MRFTKEFSRLVDKDLKNRDPLTDAETSILYSDLDGWIAVLKDFKAEVEVQFTYFKKESAEKTRAYAYGDIDERQFDDWIVETKTRRLNAARLLKSIESKLVYVKYERQRQTNKHLSDDSDADRGSYLPAARSV